MSKRNGLNVLIVKDGKVTFDKAFIKAIKINRKIVSDKNNRLKTLKMCQNIYQRHMEIYSVRLMDMYFLRCEIKYLSENLKCLKIAYKQGQRIIGEFGKHEEISYLVDLFNNIFYAHYKMIYLSVNGIVPGKELKKRFSVEDMLINAFDDLMATMKRR